MPRSENRSPFITLTMETVSTSETSVNFYETPRRNIQEDRHFQDEFSPHPSTPMY
jgi:hypothetical protein